MNHDEHGSALVLAIGVMALVGVVSAGLLSFVTTSVSARSALDTVRNREYAADAAIENAVAVTRAQLNLSTSNACSAPSLTTNGEAINVTCEDHLNSVATPSGQFVTQRNVQFNACLAVDTCSDTTAIIRAQINFEIPSGGGVVTRTYVQSWSVQR